MKSESVSDYSSPDENLAVICINSREYKGAKASHYWFAFHPYQRDLLKDHKQTFVALGCGSADSILLIPEASFVSWLDRFHTTERGDKFYWHIRVKKNKDGYLLRVKKGEDVVKVSEYLLKA